MLAKLIALAGVLTQAAAQDPYVVWGSVIFNRIGERTPNNLGTISTVLTSRGAQQSWSSGQFFRNRYLTGQLGGIHGLSTNIVDSTQLYVLALDEQASAASAQAFVQGLYPPYTVNSTNASITLDPSSVTSSGSYIESPLNGYQYAQIHVSGALDPDYVYIGANVLCNAYDAYGATAINNTDYQSLLVSSKSVYRAVGPFLRSVLDEADWNFSNAYDIFDWVSYLAGHNPNIAALLEQPQYIDPATNQSYLYTLQWLADRQQQFLLANMTAYNSLTKTSTLPETAGSISTIAGNFLAAKMLSHLQSNVQTRGQYYKLSVLFGDFEPLYSLFQLMNLPQMDTGKQFLGLPAYASSAAFELYSWGNNTNVTFPDTDDLYVRFHFSNGTNYTNGFQKFSAFNRGPSNADMSWTDFTQLMYNIALGGVGDWCMQCHAQNLFCAAWNDTIELTSASGSIRSASNTYSGQLPPTAAGAVGAVVALAVATLLFGLVMLIGGIRFHRKPRTEKELGGFKGSAKMASDRDLTLPKSGITVDERAAGAHERTGSWEMKNAERKPSFDEDDLHVNPFADPVKPREAV